ncbi:hypothetical protein DFR55_102128 [Herbinix hemicellulosilytica]|uniref:Putative membrane protein n=1 Tax=Herbinix hemicellulosilytica TaxID=1564487 RepID=A0A0H5SES7_HERHM|nr:hypothetical protein [Herbinix hemicellulosilytica]RBP60333.1 hypothetical protein DFR55_102128 [Herbinix hemicellulosilytica]CRZ33525.1 putative membrane protein [Herbinix hemicellulosilytica]
MDKLKSVIKYLFLSVFASAVYWLLNYSTGKEVTVKTLIILAAALFACFCLFAFALPALRKFWHQNKN